jgi:hypothetical protein
VYYSTHVFIFASSVDSNILHASTQTQTHTYTTLYLQQQKKTDTDTDTDTPVEELDGNKGTASEDKVVAVSDVVAHPLQISL